MSIEWLLNHKPEQTGMLKRCYGYCHLLFNSGFAGFMVVKEVTASSTSQVSQCDAIYQVGLQLAKMKTSFTAWISLSLFFTIICTMQGE